jgi:hypothetical protein
MRRCAAPLGKTNEKGSRDTHRVRHGEKITVLQGNGFRLTQFVGLVALLIVS